jgi:hypothetical protein
LIVDPPERTTFAAIELPSMDLRTLGKGLLSVSAITFVIACVRIAWFVKTFGLSLGFDPAGMWKMWGLWILLWLFVTAAGFVLLRRRPA